MPAQDFDTVMAAVDQLMAGAMDEVAALSMADGRACCAWLSAALSRTPGWTR